MIRYAVLGWKRYGSQVNKLTRHARSKGTAIQQAQKMTSSGFQWVTICNLKRGSCEAYPVVKGRKT